MASKVRTFGVAVLVVAVLATVLVVGWRKLWDRARAVFHADTCTVASFDVSPDQAATASSMVGVVIRRRLPERAAVLVLAAALQESKISNIPAGQGDLDSVGVLQQRPSQGWGTATQLSDVRFATGAFLDALVKHDNWQTVPLAQAIQEVQISADGGAYAQHEGLATALSGALMGKTAAGISCEFAAPGTVAAAGTVAAQVQRDLPVNRPTTNDRLITVPGAAWATAAWFVANADRLGIERVSYAGQQWKRGSAWKARSGVGGAAVVAELYHH